MTTHIVTNLLPQLCKLFSKQTTLLWINAKLQRIQYARKVSRQRRDLASLTSAQLKDIGISQYEADKESSRGFWDLPEENNS